MMGRESGAQRVSRPDRFNRGPTATLALSLVILALSLGAALLGGSRDGLYADAGSPETTGPLKAASGR